MLNGIKYKEIIMDEKEFDIDENSYFTIVKYDVNFDNKKKIIFYSLKMILLSIFLLIIDSFGDIQKNDSFYYMSYRFKCISNCVINGDNLDNDNFNKKRTVEAFFNTLYLILSFIIFGSIIFILGSIIYNK